MMKSGVWTCFMALFCGFGLGQETYVIEPGDMEAVSTALQPHWARYQETRTQGGQVRTGYRITELQELKMPEGLGWQAVIHMLGQDTVTDEWRFLQRSFDPVTRMISARSMVHKVEVFGDQVLGASMAGDGGSAKPLAMTMKGRRFPATVVSLVLSQKELKPGDVYVFPVFSSDMGAAFANLYAEMNVLRQEKASLPRGKEVRAWVIESRFLNEEREPLPFPTSQSWIIDEAPYLIKSVWPQSEIVLETVIALPKLPVSSEK